MVVVSFQNFINWKVYKLAFPDNYFNVFCTSLTVISEIVTLKFLLLQSVDVHQSSSTCGGRWLHGADPSFSVIITPNVSSFLIVNMSWFCADLSCTASVEYLCNVTCSCSVSFFSPSEHLSFQCQICQKPQYLCWALSINFFFSCSITTSFHQ